MGHQTARAAYRRLSRWRRYAIALRRHFRPQDVARSRPDLRELSAQERQRLHAVAHGETSWASYFAPRLEREFQRHTRIRSRDARLVLAFIPLVLFGSCPFWMPGLLGLPETLRSLLTMIALTVIAPLFLTVVLAQARYPTRSLTEVLLIGASLVQVFCLEWVRYQTELLGFQLDPALSVTIPVAVIALGRLPLGRSLILIGGYLGIIALKDLYFAPMGSRPVTTWMVTLVLLGVTLLSAVWTRLASRQQWASNLLLEMIAYKDALTGLPNRRALEEHFTLVSRGLRRTETKTVFLALIDLDHFKNLNDSFGHEFGDGVLTEVGVVLAEFARRPLDMAARVGGEEFALLLYDCPIDAGRARLEELVDAVRGLGIEYGDFQEKRVTCSAGAAAGLPGTPMSTLLRIADEHLYKAKREGRDRISVEEEPVGARLVAVGTAESRDGEITARTAELS